ncbi:MAG: hypothetical protein F4Z60_10655 [Chloroflexi bacterium]|nr:hypothetical protein [Chloroflexota bacterium]
MQAPTAAGTGAGSLRFVNACTRTSKSSRQAAISTGNRPAGVAWISIRRSPGRCRLSGAAGSLPGTGLRVADA